ncbi:hypothetical protein IFM89_003123 [Coptis chinensis]|uniref:DUF3598 domain-containing protein n=1 Tax=Coptis chinensis TaxID=261450 RepID=A0A835IWF2_9MAGN|nr:hypothetical protein IFM89_003123 [Coptis chinensis]
MATISTIPLTPLSKTPNSKLTHKHPLSFLRPYQFPQLVPSCHSLRTQAVHSSSSVTDEEQRRNEESTSIDTLKSFVNVNVGKWNGTFYQFDARGNLMQEVRTKLSASSYGEEQLISLIQTLYIKQPTSNTSVSGYDSEPEWGEYKIKESNMFTVDKYQQIGFFPKERAFSLRYQTAGMLEAVLRQGVLGEDDTGEESPKNLKVPSHRPSIVCENCLYSRANDMRARAFHILDPRGVLEMVLIFLEERGDGLPQLPSTDSKDSTSVITPFLGRWEGHSITKRSGVYGATVAEADTVALLEIDDENQLIQDITTTSSGGNVTTNVHWAGTISDSLVVFDGGFQMTLLPGGMYIGCPCDVAKSVEESRSFHLEFCWMDSPGKRQNLFAHLMPRVCPFPQLIYVRPNYDCIFYIIICIAIELPLSSISAAM